MNYFEFHMPDGTDLLINLDAVRSIEIIPTKDNFSTARIAYHNGDIETISAVTPYRIRLLKDCAIIQTNE